MQRLYTRRSRRLSHPSNGTVPNTTRTQSVSTRKVSTIYVDNRFYGDEIKRTHVQWISISHMLFLLQFDHILDHISWPIHHQARVYDTQQPWCCVISQYSWTCWTLLKAAISRRRKSADAMVENKPALTIVYANVISRALYLLAKNEPKFKRSERIQWVHYSSLRGT